MNLLDILGSKSFLNSAGRKPTIPGTNVRVPRFLDPRRIYMDPKRIINPTGVRGGLLTALGLGALNEATGRNIPDKDLLAAEMLLTLPLSPASVVAAGVVHDINNPFEAGTVFDEKTGALTPMSMSEREIRIARGEKDPYPNFGPDGRMRVGPYDNEFVVPGSRTNALLDTDEKPTVEMGRPDPFAPITSEEKSIQPSQQPPSAPESSANESAVEEVKKMLLSDGASNYQDFTKQEINDYYDQLRKQDPEKAVKFGKDVNNVLFGYY